MHQAMLDGHLEHLKKMGMAFLRPPQGTLDGAIQFFADAAHVTVNLRARRPIRRRVRWKSAANGIDPESKELIEGLMKGAQSKRTLREKVPVKRLHMPDVKYDTVPLRDWAVVDGVLADHLEDF